MFAPQCQRSAQNGCVRMRSLSLRISPDIGPYPDVREIFKRHTDLIEPLSLDEAYLDVTTNKTGLPTATLVARTIREQIRKELNLTASAGVAPNKFLAKLASDWKKPDGLFVIQPNEVDAFLLPLPVGKLPGVGKVNEEKLAKLGVKTVGELRSIERSKLEQEFGRYGVRLYELARGMDENPVVPDRPTKSISVEDTFQEDVLLADTEPMIRRLAEKLWSASRKEARIPRTVVLKLKTIQDPHSQSHGKRASVLLRRTNRDRPQAARAGDSRSSAALSSRRGRSEQFSGSRTDWASTSAFRITPDQSAAAVTGGCCFIISSIPFFISFAEGSALWVPTIQL